MKKTISLLTFLAFLTNLHAIEDSYYHKTTKFDVPLREVSIIATDEGYYPKTITVFKGEKLKIFLTGKDRLPNCLTLPEKDFYMSAQKGEISEGSLYFEKPGTYHFYCPTGKIKGRITVLERPSTRIEKLKRSIASEPDTKGQWMPRDR